MVEAEENGVFLAQLANKLIVVVTVEKQVPWPRKYTNSKDFNCKKNYVLSCLFYEKHIEKYCGLHNVNFVFLYIIVFSQKSVIN